MYLDNTALIDMGEALDGVWIPPDPLTEEATRRVAAARLAMYGCSDRGWTIATSTVAKAEGLRGLAHDLVTPSMVEVDELSGGPGEATLEELVATYKAAGVDGVDARHVAECASRPWIGYFVTNDTKILKRAPAVELQHSLGFVTVQQAEALLGIEPGESPCVVPASSNPMSRLAPWWVP